MRINLEMNQELYNTITSIKQAEKTLVDCRTLQKCQLCQLVYQLIIVTMVVY